MVEDTVVEESNIGAEEQRLHEFNVNEFSDYIEELEVDEETKTRLHEILRDRKVGWQMRARWLIRAKIGYEKYERNMQALLEKITMPSKARGPASQITKLPVRDSQRLWLNKLTPEQLQELCQMKNVSYESFMHTNDRSGLIEAILDELLLS